MVHLPKELQDKPSIVATFVIDGDKSQVFFDFSKELQMETEDEINNFFNLILYKLNSDFLSALGFFLKAKTPDEEKQSEQT